MKTLLMLIVLMVFASLVSAQSPRILSNDGKFLGNLNSDKYDPNSVANPYGQYGSKYSPDSVKNPYGQYGSKYSPNSVNNPLAPSPIIIPDNQRKRIHP